MTTSSAQRLLHDVRQSPDEGFIFTCRVGCRWGDRLLWVAHSSIVFVWWVCVWFVSIWVRWTADRDTSIFGLVRGSGVFAAVLPTFVLVSRMQVTQRYRGHGHFLISVSSSWLETMVGDVLTRVSTWCVVLGVSGATIVSGSCAHPSHSWISHLLTSSLSLGISSLFCRVTHCMWGIIINNSGGFFTFVVRCSSGNLLTKAEDLRINLNLDGTPITSKSHTHPSHSETSRLPPSWPRFSLRGPSRSPSRPMSPCHTEHFSSFHLCPFQNYVVFNG